VLAFHVIAPVAAFATGYGWQYVVLWMLPLVTLLQAILSKSAAGRATFVERGQLKQVLKVLIPAGLFVLGIQLIGIYVASAIYIALFMNLLGDYPWKKSVPLAVAISVLFFFMFEVWFQVPLFKGYWNLTGWTGF